MAIRLTLLAKVEGNVKYVKKRQTVMMFPLVGCLILKRNNYKTPRVEGFYVIQ